MLKTLEEPPAHIVFILATTEPQRLPATIISRCQRFDFRRLSVDDMVRRMKEVVTDAGGSIEDEGLLAIARAADGGMRDALSLADQCLSFCGQNVSAEDVYSVLGGMDNDFLFSVADALIDSKADDALKKLEQVVNDGRDLTVFSHDLTLHMRALLVTKLCGHCSDILDCTEENMRRYMEQAQRSTCARLERAVSLLLNAQSNLRWLTLPRVLLESTLVKITRPEDEATVAALTDRIQRLEEAPMTVKYIEVPTSETAQNADKAENKKAEKATSQDDTPPWEESIPAEKLQKETPPQNKQADKQSASDNQNDAESLWNNVLGALQKTEVTLYVMAKFGKKVSISGNSLKVGFDKKAFIKALEMPDKKRVINELIAKYAPDIAFVPYEIGSGGENIEQRARSLFGDKLEIE